MSESSASREPERRAARGIRHVAGRVCAAAAVLVALYLLSRTNYLLFHGIIELFAVVVGCAIFVVAWNTRRWVSNDYLLFLGIAYLSVAVVDVYHTLAYRGMGVFPEFGPNQPTQFWILARYLEAASLLLAPVFLTRRLPVASCFLVYGLAVGSGLLSICRLGVFPDCFIEGQGLTAFKVTSEYVISLALLAALWLLYRRRSAFEPRVFHLLVAAILTTVAAEMTFTLYTDVYGIANVVGHLFKLVSFFLVYRAVVVTSLITPYSLLFRDLKNERDRAQSYLDAAGVVMLVLDPAGMVRLINRRGADLLGYREDEILGRNWFEEFLPEARRATAQGLFARLMAGETTVAEYAEGPVRVGGGGSRTIAWHNTVLRDNAGAIVGMLSSGDDVTEQRVAERALAASEERLKLLFDRAPDAYYLSDLDGRFVDANAAAEALIGFPKEELLGKSFAESGLLRPQDLHRAAQLLAASFGGNATGPDELTLVRRDGSIVVAEIRTEPVELDGRKLVLGIARDATGRKAAERALKESEERFRSLFNNAIEGVFSLDLEGRLTQANPALVDLMDMSAKEAIGKGYSDLLSPGSTEAVLEVFTRLLATREPIREYLMEMTLFNGRHLWIELNASQVVVDGAVIGVQGSVRDVSERKQAEERELAARARLERLVSILQHEALSVQEFLDYALEQAIGLTESRLGYIYLYDQERREFTLNTWSREVMKECTIQDPQTGYQLEKTGIWGEAVRQRRAIVVNDFDAAHPLKRGYPQGHAQLHRFATIPVFSADRIVAVVGVANRATDYTNLEVLQLTLLMDAVWKVVERKRTEQLLKQSTERLERAMSVGNLAWWQMSLPSGAVVFDGRKATMLGHRPELFSHYSDFTALLHQDDYGRAMEAMRDHLQGRAERYEVEYRIRTAAGEYRWFRDVGSVTSRNPDGTPAVVTGVVVDVSNLKATEEGLTRSNTELQALAARLDVAREEERAAVAWELHDQIAQALAAMKMDVESCSRRLPEDVLSRVEPGLERVRDLLDETIGRLRRLYTDLVPVMLEDLGLAATVDWEAEQFRRQSGIEVEVGRVCDVPSLDERTQLGIFRVLQEALHGASRSAGVTRINIDFEPDDGHAVLRVSHDGSVLAGAADGSELIGIRERARSWGGQVSVETSPVAGVVLKVTVPLPTAIRG